MSRANKFITFFTKIRNGITWRMPNTSGGVINIDFTDFQFAEAIFTAILKKLLEGLQNTEYQLVSRTPSFEKQKLFNSFVNLFENKIEQILLRYIAEGVVYFKIDSENHLILVDGKHEATHFIYSTTYKLYGKSDKAILQNNLSHIDNILNAVSTTTKKLGVLTMLTPENNSDFDVRVTEDELKEFENDLQKDYGALSTQTQIKVMRRKFNVNTINLAGANLRTNENLQTAVKILCDVLEVPYELVSCAIVGNPNQTGVYQKEAVKRLYATVEKFVQKFVNFAGKEFNLILDYEILTKPHDDLKVEWEANKLIIETINLAVANGSMSKEEGTQQIRLHLNI